VKSIRSLRIVATSRKDEIINKSSALRKKEKKSHLPCLSKSMQLSLFGRQIRRKRILIQTTTTIMMTMSRKSLWKVSTFSLSYVIIWCNENSRTLELSRISTPKRPNWNYCIHVGPNFTQIGAVLHPKYFQLTIFVCHH
jgi:hypothetical protein